MRVLLPIVGVLALIALTDATSDAAAQDADRRVAARKLLDEADRLVAESTMASSKRAAALYAEALEDWRAIGDRREQARALAGLGVSHHGLHEYQKAIEYYGQAASAWEALGDRRELAATYDRLGEAYISSIGSREALEPLTRALSIWQTIGDAAGEGRTMTNLGEAYHILGDNQKALDYFHRALPLRADGGEVVVMQNIGMIHFYLGDGRQAVDVLTEALARSRAYGNRMMLDAHILGNLARACASVGERQQALDRYAESLQLWKTVGDRVGEGLALQNMARTYHEMGQDGHALDRYAEALAIFRARGLAGLESRVLEQIGRLHARSGRNRDALKSLLRALSLLGTGRDLHRESDTLHSIASVYGALREYGKAVTFYDRALSLKRSIGDRRGEAQSLHGLGELHATRGRHAKALKYYQRALALQRAVGDKDAEAATITALARVEGERGNLADARSALEQALQIVDSLRARVISRDFRASYAAAWHQSYELYVDVLMRQHAQAASAGLDALAFEASERARARSLVETLAETRVDIRAGVDSALLGRERAIQQALNAKEQYRVRLITGAHTAEQAESVEAELRSLFAEYQEVQARIRAESPRYAVLAQPRPLGLADIQAQLDGETLLVEYSLGVERSFLWVVARDSLSSAVLPTRSALEREARRLHQLLRAGGHRLAQGQARLALTRLGQRLLGPAIQQLQTAKRVLVVAEGALQYIPFSALTLVEDPSAPPLAATHELVHLPSASALSLLARETPGDGPATGIAVFADPVFDARDDRLGRTGRRRTLIKTPASSTLAARDVERSARDSGATLARLRFSRREADAIAAAAGKEQTHVALDFRASRATLAALDLGNYRIIHFATHALINNRYPELSGIVLSLVNEQGRPQDGFLRVHEIYSLKLSADLVVLSACQTALGKDVRGEGLVGLSRAFMYAGAPRIVVSLWNVSDEVTAELMKRFYRAMLVDGLRPPAALRAAQISLSRQKRWQAPYYWAGFVLQGDWK